MVCAQLLVDAVVVATSMLIALPCIYCVGLGWGRRLFDGLTKGTVGIACVRTQLDQNPGFDLVDKPRGKRNVPRPRVGQHQTPWLYQ